MVDETRPIVCLIGSEHEENLSLRYLASAVRTAGFDARLVACSRPEDQGRVIDEVLRANPLVVGISIPFQHHARACLALAGMLRAAGYRGHICAGGHFATFEYEAILRDFPSLDSIVRHEGEESFRELCRGVRDGRCVADLRVPGLVARDGDRLSVSPPRPLPPLDDLAFPDRSDAPRDVLGVPCSPMVASRGCYASCTFCCIHAYSRTAEGPRYRMRSIPNVVAEMRREHQERGVRLFVFHDDNFFVPSAPKNLERYRDLAAALRREGMDDIGIVIKCRPSDVNADLVALLKRAGMIRAYVGVETNSDEGLISLNRRVGPDENRRALEVLRDEDVYCSFNVLIFDPEATLRGVAANLDFMEDVADTPFNFCRAEVYAGTPLQRMLESQGRLEGNYLAWYYEMRDPRVELLFRIASTAFASRNFKWDGVANLNMGIRFDSEVMRKFYPSAWEPQEHERLRELSRAIGLDSVAYMRAALAFVQEAEPRDGSSVKAFTLELARAIALADLRFVAQIKGLRTRMESRVRQTTGRDARHRSTRCSESGEAGGGDQWVSRR